MWAVFKEFLRFSRREKKWWLIPLVVVLLLLAVIFNFCRQLRHLLGALSVPVSDARATQHSRDFGILP